jgi:hypothetical protein
MSYVRHRVPVKTTCLKTDRRCTLRTQTQAFTMVACQQTDPLKSRNTVPSKLFKATATTIVNYFYRGADKSLARPGRKQAIATEDFDFHISYL